ncbi:unnamed protein product [Protopolystoma xenopodis]|uniref:Uncharacterized protein n=1 Tax=Protopolystoma xenopodis TaxID=117903 RepID=A0A3S5AI94_9PLAT|nr:unnamed protein product [Protopolystoma xenopodis]
MMSQTLQINIQPTFCILQMSELQQAVGRPWHMPVSRQWRSPGWPITKILYRENSTSKTLSSRV